MTVKELQEELNKYDQSAQIGFSYRNEDEYIEIDHVEMTHAYRLEEGVPNKIITPVLISDRDLDYDELCEKATHILKDEDELLDSGLITLDQVELLKMLIKKRYR